MPRGFYGEIKGCGGLLFVAFLLLYHAVARPFAATRKAVRTIERKHVEWPLAILFLPAALALDVLLLPISLTLLVVRTLRAQR